VLVHVNSTSSSVLKNIVQIRPSPNILNTVLRKALGVLTSSEKELINTMRVRRAPRRIKQDQL
jgi:hypothetical protein